MSEHSADPDIQGQVEVLITANQAFPRLEHLFLKARKHIVLGFRLFDPDTRLHSDEARALGDTWSDLVAHTLGRGVDIDLTLSDFDPVMVNDMHVQGQSFERRFNALNDGAGRMTARCLLYPAQGGLVPRLLFAFRTRKDLFRLVKRMNRADDPAQALQQAPGLHDLLSVENGRVKARPFALPRLYPLTLHHKLAVFDGEVTYIGGLDLNNRRFDDTDHNQAAQDTWHDLQLVLNDTAFARDAARFLDQMPRVIAGEQPPARPASPFVCTLARQRRSTTFSLRPKPLVADILDSHLAPICTARHLIYLESQYFRDRRVARALVAAAAREPGLALPMLLPAAPEDVAFEPTPGLEARFGEHLQARAIRKVRRAFGDRFLVVSPAQPRAPRPGDTEEERARLADAPIVYVHSKVSLFDDRSAIVSSANLNGRSLKWDAEAGVVLRDPEVVGRLRDAVFRHWLTENAGPEFFAPETAFAAWQARAFDNAARAPGDRTGFVLPHAVQPAKRLGQPLPGAPEEMV